MWDFHGKYKGTTMSAHPKIDYQTGEMIAYGYQAKGDLTDDGRAEEFAAFEACYRPAFGPRLHVVRGNHDAFRGQIDYAGDQSLDAETRSWVFQALRDITGQTLPADASAWREWHARLRH